MSEWERVPVNSVIFERTKPTKLNSWKYINVRYWPLAVPRTTQNRHFRIAAMRQEADIE